MYRVKKIYNGKVKDTLDKLCDSLFNKTYKNFIKRSYTIFTNEPLNIFIISIYMFITTLLKIKN